MTTKEIEYREIENTVVTEQCSVVLKRCKSKDTESQLCRIKKPRELLYIRTIVIVLYYICEFAQRVGTIATPIKESLRNNGHANLLNTPILLTLYI